MDKVIYSISKNDMHNYILENVMENKFYQFNDISEIIEVFSDTDMPQLSGFEKGKVSTSSKNKIDIHKRVVNTLNERKPKYFWSTERSKFDHLEKVSVKEVLKHIKKNMKGW